MRRGYAGSPSGGLSLWYIVGWGLIVAIGAALVWFGFFGSAGPGGREGPDASPEATATSLGFPTAVPTAAVLFPTATQPQPTSPLPTPTVPAPTATSVPTSKLVAGDSGVNVRSGPDVSFTRLGYLEPGTSAEITGKYDDWFQIDYDGSPGWVYGELVAATNTDNVPVVQPPAAPTSPPAQATTAPTAAPTVVPTQALDTRGIAVNKYSVRGAPGPYGVGAEIWFDFSITNKSSGTIAFDALGTWVQETGQKQKSWMGASLEVNKKFVWSDKLTIAAPGTYHLYLFIELAGGDNVLLSGPIIVNVQ